MESPPTECSLGGGYISSSNDACYCCTNSFDALTNTVENSSWNIYKLATNGVLECRLKIRPSPLVDWRRELGGCRLTYNGEDLSDTTNARKMVHANQTLEECI